MTVGGEKTLPFLGFEAVNAHRPVLAVEVNDIDPRVWSPELAAAWEGVAGDPAAWAARAVEAGADLIALRLRGAHPEFGDASADALRGHGAIGARRRGRAAGRLRPRRRRERQ